MPISEQRARHLLRRTEFVDRQSRVDSLTASANIGAAVDDILDSTLGSAGQLTLAGEGWEEAQEMTMNWLDRMASSSSPFRERMSFFWHGHICSELGKVNSNEFMRQQIDLFRADGVNGSVGQLMKDMSLQVAMLRYLDNDRNYADSPNQNFARELMELFVVGVGNYTEADVEAATAAWTGHTAHWETGEYQFVIERHEPQAQTFFGQTINLNSKPFADAGYQTIDVMLGLGDYAGGGTVPTGANNGRPTREVAAEFLSKKLWQEFGEANSGDVPAGVKSAMVDALLDNDFAIRPWLRAMFTHDDFYPDTNPVVDGGLVRQPVEYVVALMYATDRDAERVAPFWLMDLAGQVLLYPPNVSGWKPNGYWVNASAFEARNRVAQHVTYAIFDTYWEHDWNQRQLNYIEFRNGQRIYQHEIVGGQGLPAPHDIDPISNDDLVTRCLDYMDLHFSAPSKQSILDFCASHWNDTTNTGNQYDRRETPLLIMLAPEMHIN